MVGDSPRRARARGRALRTHSRSAPYPPLAFPNVRTPALTMGRAPGGAPSPASGTIGTPSPMRQSVGTFSRYGPKNGISQRSPNSARTKPITVRNSAVR